MMNAELVFTRYDGTCMRYQYSVTDYREAIRIAENAIDSDQYKNILVIVDNEYITSLSHI